MPNATAAPTSATPEMLTIIRSLRRTIRGISPKQDELNRLVQVENERRKAEIRRILDQNDMAICANCHYAHPVDELALCENMQGELAGPYCRKCLKPGSQREFRFEEGSFFYLLFPPRDGEDCYLKTTARIFELNGAEVETITSGHVFDDEHMHRALDRIRPKVADQLGAPRMLKFVHAVHVEDPPDVIDTLGV